MHGELSEHQINSWLFVVIIIALLTLLSRRMYGKDSNVIIMILIGIHALKHA